MPVSQRLTLQCIFESSDVVVLESSTIYADGCPLPKGTPLVRVCVMGDAPFVEPAKLILAALTILPDAERSALIQRLIKLDRPNGGYPAGN